LTTTLLFALTLTPSLPFAQLIIFNLFVLFEF
jgi:hypothetical protein